VPFSFGSVAEDLNLYMFIHSMIHLRDKPSKVYVTLGLLQHRTLLATNIMTKFSCCFWKWCRYLDPIYTTTQGQGSTQLKHSYWCKSWNQPQGLKYWESRLKQKKIFSICPKLLIHAELYALVLASRLKKKGIPWNLRSEFATLEANVPAFTNILTSMF